MIKANKSLTVFPLTGDIEFKYVGNHSFNYFVIPFQHAKVLLLCKKNMARYKEQNKVNVLILPFCIKT